jgi:hypothetical protein
MSSKRSSSLLPARARFLTLKTTRLAPFVTKRNFPSFFLTPTAGNSNPSIWLEACFEPPLTTNAWLAISAALVLTATWPWVVSGFLIKIFLRGDWDLPTH